MKIRDLIKKPWGEKKVTVWRGDEHPVAALHREVNRLFDQFLGDFHPKFLNDSFLPDFPRIDVKDKSKEIIVEAELPGMDDGDIHVQIDDGVLTIRGEKRQEKEEEKGDFYRAERYYGSFHRVIPLPDEVDSEKANASYRRGVLKIKLPKKPESQRKTKLIEIE